jgi:hypothetical protein
VLVLIYSSLLKFVFEAHTKAVSKVVVIGDNNFISATFVLVTSVIFLFSVRFPASSDCEVGKQVGANDVFYKIITRTNGRMMQPFFLPFFAIQWELRVLTPMRGTYWNQDVGPLCLKN